MRHGAKFRQDRSKPLRRYCKFSIFQDGCRRHLEFWKFRLFNGWDAQEVRTADGRHLEKLKNRHISAAF